MQYISKAIKVIALGLMAFALSLILIPIFGIIFGLILEGIK